jgi:hypothetical protein
MIILKHRKKSRSSQYSLYSWVYKNVALENKLNILMTVDTLSAFA